MNTIDEHLNSQLNLTMQVKLLQLRRLGLNNLTIENLRDAILNLRWKFEKPHMMNELVDDILSITKDEVLGYMRNRAIIDGNSLKISDFDDLIGGSNE